MSDYKLIIDTENDHTIKVMMAKMAGTLDDLKLEITQVRDEKDGKYVTLSDGTTIKFDKINVGLEDLTDNDLRKLVKFMIPYLPEIGPNSNWFVGGKDTGKSSVSDPITIKEWYYDSRDKLHIVLTDDKEIIGKAPRQGEPGFSPIVELEPTTNGVVIKITDQEGLKTFELKNGEPGPGGEDFYDYISGKGLGLTEEEFTNKLIEILTKKEELTRLYEQAKQKGYAKQESDFKSDLVGVINEYTKNNLITSTKLNSAIENFVTQNDINESTKNLVTNTQLTAAIKGFITADSIKDFVKSEALAEYAKKTDLKALASKTEAEAGTDDVKYMSPLKTHDAIKSFGYDTKITQILETIATMSQDIEDIKKNEPLEPGQSSDILGVEVDYENKTINRIANAVDLTPGQDFDKYRIFGGRRRCTVSDDGTITSYYGDQGFKEDGSAGQVMVYQPKFYYKVEPLKKDPQPNMPNGYHLRKANYFVSETQHEGFKLHPAFVGESGQELDYILIGAYEGSKTSDGKLASIANVSPLASTTRTSFEEYAKNRGLGWHILNSKIVSMEQLLILIEYASLNSQEAIGKGVTDTSNSAAISTGQTSSLGNSTGNAEDTDGKSSVSYRGIENDWGNIFKFVIDINVWGNGSMGGGEAYICKDFNYAESIKDNNYEGVGFQLANPDGWIKSFGYSEKYDWVFLPSETVSNESDSYIGDKASFNQNNNRFAIAYQGGRWSSGSIAGAFHWNLYSTVGSSYSNIGGRPVYVPNN